MNFAKFLGIPFLPNTSGGCFCICWDLGYTSRTRTEKKTKNGRSFARNEFFIALLKKLFLFSPFFNFPNCTVVTSEEE